MIMIDVSNLKDALETLGFVAHGDIHEKVFPEIGCSLKVDFHAKKLIYPNEIKGRERNNGFDKKENFVVFECVCRLLSKGYRPEHIELEKEWHLGHDPKGGRADICVTDTSGNMLFIIECKTWGREYDKALNNTKSDGAQLFSYWQQEQSCKWLVLYASDLKGGCIVHKASTIDCSDDANIVLLSKKDKSIKLYRDANTASAKYEAWKETYGRQIHDDLIFSKDSVAYQIGVKPLRKKDLRDFTPDDKIVNKFEEILRHNNVSDKENAFNRLVALFICMVSTKNMLDFSRIDFNKAIRTSVRKPVEIHSKYPIVKLSSVVEIISGGTPDTKVSEYWGGDIPWLSVADFNNGNRFVKTAEKHITQKGLENSNARFLNVGDIIISARGTVGAVAQIAAPMTFNQSCYGLRGNDQIDNGFLYYVLSFERPYIESLATGMKFPSIVKNTLDQIQIPLPPMDVQKKLVHACAKIDEEYNATRMRIETYRQKTADLFAELDAVMSTTEGDRLSLSDTEKFSVAIGKRVLDKELASNGTIPVYSANVTSPFGFIDKLLITDFSVPSVLWGIDGDWMTSYLPSDMPFYPTDHCGVLRCKNSEVNPRYLAHILEVEGRKMGFSRSYRASIDRVHGIAFTVPDISIQNNAMSKVADYEMAIKELEGSLEKIASRRSEIIRKALAE